MSISTSTGTPISTIRVSIASNTSRISRRAGKEKEAHSSMTRAIERASVTEITTRRRSSTEERMPKRPRRATIFAVGRKAAGKNWRARVVPATGVVWEKREVLATGVDSEIRVVWQVGVAVEAA
jgi:hypothetical protein